MRYLYITYYLDVIGNKHTTDYIDQKAAVDAYNVSNKWHKRGIALVPMQWPLEYFGIVSAFITVYHRDGSVVVKHGGIECGQGINTKVAQVVAHTLGIPMKLVSVKPTDNVSTANSFTTGGSVTSESACYVCSRGKVPVWNTDLMVHGLYFVCTGGQEVLRATA